MLFIHPGKHILTLSHARTRTPTRQFSWRQMRQIEFIHARGAGSGMKFFITESQISSETNVNVDKRQMRQIAFIERQKRQSAFIQRQMRQIEFIHACGTSLTLFCLIKVSFAL